MGSILRKLARKSPRMIFYSDKNRFIREKEVRPLLAKRNAFRKLIPWDNTMEVLDLLRL